MQRIVLISCASKKLEHCAKAKDMYISQLFKLNYQYAQLLKPDKVFILSAKYGLLDINTVIEPYNETLNKKSVKEIKEWSKNVIERLNQEIDFERDEVIFMAGEKYRRFLVPLIKNCKIPLIGMPIGKQLQYLKEKVK